MNPQLQLVRAARAATSAMAYGIFNLAGAKLGNLTRNIVESTDPVKSVLIAERDLRIALAAIDASKLLGSSSNWKPFSTAPRDGTKVDLWNDEKKYRVLDVSFILAVAVDPRFAQGGVWEHCAMDGWRHSVEQDSVLVEDGYTHWRLSSDDRP